MSHFACPLCGKNASKRSYNPENLELDLQEVTFGSTGRGGIYVADKTSVLGDDELSPIVADRALNLCKMFLDAGTLVKDQVEHRLGLEDSAQREMVITRLQIQLAEAKKDRDEYLAEYNYAKIELDKQKEEQERKKRVDTVLLQFASFCDYEIKVNNNLDWEVWVNKIKSKNFSNTLELFKYLESDIKVNVLDRVKTNEPKLEKIFEFLRMLPKEKSLAEKLLETDVVRLPDGREFFPLN